MPIILRQPPSSRKNEKAKTEMKRPKDRNQKIPDPEVSEKPVRRRFSAKYKRQILNETDAATKSGQIGAILRREGLYSSNLLAWRRQRDKAINQGLAVKKRGRKPVKDPKDEQIKRLERENARLKQRFEEAELIIEIQKKTSQLLGIKLTDVSEHEKKIREEENG